MHHLHHQHLAAAHAGVSHGSALAGLACFGIIAFFAILAIMSGKRAVAINAHDDRKAVRRGLERIWSGRAIIGLMLPFAAVMLYGAVH